MAKTKKSQDCPKPLLNNLTNSQRTVAISLSSAQKVLYFLLRSAGNQKMALHFIGKQKISTLHADYFNDPSPTDCITFPYEDPEFLGEVFVCPQVAREYIQEHGGNLYDEITLYVVHGFLHLIGYRDHTPKEKKKMRAQEKKWLQSLAKNNLRITP